MDLRILQFFAVIVVISQKGFASYTNQVKALGSVEVPYFPSSILFNRGSPPAPPPSRPRQVSSIENVQIVRRLRDAFTTDPLTS